MWDWSNFFTCHWCSRTRTSYFSVGSFHYLRLHGKGCDLHQEYFLFSGHWYEWHMRLQFECDGREIVGNWWRGVGGRRCHAMHDEGVRGVEEKTVNLEELWSGMSYMWEHATSVMEDPLKEAALQWPAQFTLGYTTAASNSTWAKASTNANMPSPCYEPIFIDESLSRGTTTRFHLT